MKVPREELNAWDRDRAVARLVQQVSGSVYNWQLGLDCEALWSYVADSNGARLPIGAIKRLARGFGPTLGVANRLRILALPLDFRSKYAFVATVKQRINPARARLEAATNDELDLILFGQRTLRLIDQGMSAPKARQQANRGPPVEDRSLQRRFARFQKLCRSKGYVLTSCPEVFGPPRRSLANMTRKSGRPRGPSDEHESPPTLVFPPFISDQET